MWVKLLTIFFVTFLMAFKGYSDLRIWHGLDGELGKILEKLVEDYNQRFQQDPDFLPVHLECKGDYEQTLKALLSVLGTEQQPHACHIYKFGAPVIVHMKGKNKKSAYISLPQVMQAGGFSFKDDYFISSVSTYYKLHKRQLQSLPFNASTVILFYNKTAFDKAGLLPPQTWEDFPKIAAVLKAKGYPNILAAGCLHGHHLIQTGAYHNKPIATKGNGTEGLYTRLIVNSPFFQTHFKNLATWYQKDWFSLKSGPDAEKAFAEEEFVLLTQNSNRLPNIEKAVNGKFEIGVAAFPYWKSIEESPQNTICSGGSFWTMAGFDLKTYKALAKFYHYLTSFDVQWKWHTQTCYIPVVRGVKEEAEAKGFYNKGLYGTAAKIALESLSNKEPKTYSRDILLPHFPQIRSIIMEYLVKAIKGEMPVEEALQIIEEKGNELLK
ncbi:MAG: extracellular solute-binding protein [Proteobacteria bacterium]|nr:extracellular solute-binding protein [Pseudomonadota bacterium]